MGEPLNNYSALVEAVRVMIGSPFLLSPKRITISTVCTLIFLFSISLVFTLYLILYEFIRFHRFPIVLILVLDLSVDFLSFKTH